MPLKKNEVKNVYAGPKAVFKPENAFYLFADLVLSHYTRSVPCHTERKKLYWADLLVKHNIYPP